MEAQPRQHVNEAIRAEEVDASAQQIADARLRDPKGLGCLGLRQPLRRDHLLQLNHQIGANEQMLGLFGWRLFFLGILGSLLEERAITIPRKIEFRFRCLARALLERMKHIHRFVEGGHVEHAMCELQMVARSD